MGLFSKGPEQTAAQRRLDAAHTDGRRRTRAEAEELSDAVDRGRQRDRQARRGR